MNNDIKEIKRPGQILDYVDTKEHLVELFNYITNLQEHNKQLVKDILNQDKKIDKAIEYIEDNMSYVVKGNKEYIPAGEELLDILRGDSDENK